MAVVSWQLGELTVRCIPFSSVNIQSLLTRRRPDEVEPDPDTSSASTGDMQRAKSRLAKALHRNHSDGGGTNLPDNDWNLVGGRSDGAGGGISTTRRVEFEVSLAA